MSSEPSNDGWTYITKASGRRKIQSALNAPGIPPITRDMTVDAVSKDFHKKKKIWRASTSYVQLRQTLDRLRPERGWNVQNAVCLAVGSFSRDNLECRRRSMWQIVVFSDILEHLRADAPGEIDAAVQEPILTDLDQEFLATIGMRQLKVDPEPHAPGGLGPAQDLCGSATFLFEAFMDMDTASLRDLVQADVELYIGSSMNGRIERAKSMNASIANRSLGTSKAAPSPNNKVGLIEAENRIVTEFAGRHQMYRFPSFNEDPGALEGLFIYVRDEIDD